MTTTHPTRPTLSQRRAAHAWSAIKCVVSQPNSQETLTELETKCKKLASRIQASGLGQALAFSCAKKDGLYLVSVLVEWLQHKPNTISAPVETNMSIPKCQIQFIGKFLEDAILNSQSSESLRIYTQESIAYLPWFSRFAEGAIKLNENQSEPIE
jgi:CRISPR type III-B/RAMP module-associated protein Cmr5